MVSVEEAVPPGLRLTLVGLKEADRLPEDTEAERLTVPAKEARLLTVMVDVPELPAKTTTVPGLEDSVKSPTPTVMVVVWDRVPLVAVTVTV